MLDVPLNLMMDCDDRSGLRVDTFAILSQNRITNFINRLALSASAPGSLQDRLRSRRFYCYC